MHAHAYARPDAHTGIHTRYVRRAAVRRGVQHINSDGDRIERRRHMFMYLELSSLCQSVFLILYIRRGVYN